MPHRSVPPSAEGLTILHLTDWHVRARSSWGTPHAKPDRWWARMLDEASEPVDLVALTGDFMDHPGDESAAARCLEALLPRLRARLGVLGVFGNHDSIAGRHVLRNVGGVDWLGTGEAGGFWRWFPHASLRVVGDSYPEDLVAATLESPRVDDAHGDRPLVLMLAHYPTRVLAASGLGIDVVLAGHTHGGQIRPHARWTPHTSCDMPTTGATGLVEHGGTVVCVGRGMGEGHLPVRVRCRRHAPLYRLVRGDEDHSGPSPSGIRQRRAW